MNTRSVIHSAGALAAISVIGLTGVTAQAASNTTPQATSRAVSGPPNSPAPTGISVPPNSPVPTASLAALKARCAAAVSRRLVTLTADAGTVNGVNAVTTTDRTTLLTLFSNDETGLTALNATIQADATFAQAKADCETIVTDYRVYVLVGPKMNLTLAADRTARVDSEFASLATELQADLNNSSLSTVQKAAAQQAINDLNSKVASARASVAPVSAEVLALTPAGYPGNDTTLEAARTSLSSAHQSLDGAMADVRTVLKALGN